MKPQSFLAPVDWTALDKPIDPYLWWLDSTEYRALIRDNRIPLEFSFIAEGDSVALETAITNSPYSGRVKIQDIYRQLLSKNERPRFWTLRFDFSAIDAQQPEMQPSEVRVALLWLIGEASIVRLQIGFPRSGTNYVDPAVKVQRQLASPSHRLADRSNAEVVIGVIDDGCAFAHDRLRSGAGTRVAAVWCQTTFANAYSPSVGWKLPAQFDYGRELLNSNLNALMSLHTANGEVQELECYGQLVNSEKPNRRMLGRESHGAAITMLAAGKLRDSEDAASAAPVIFVDLPIEQAAISSGRWMAVNGLDAMRYIQAKARENFQRADKKPLPVVINLSSGSGGGAHDGTAMLERAMDEMLEHDEHLAVTLAAGNSRLAKSHLRKSALANSESYVEFFIPHAKKWETYVEIWLPRDESKNPDFLKNLSFELFSPDLDKKEVVLGSGDFITSPTSEKIAGINFCQNVVQSIDRAMVLVVVAATQIHSYLPHAAAGVWRVKVTNNNKAALQLDCWIERDEIVFGARRPQMARFVADPPAFSPQTQWAESSPDAMVRRDGTLSSIASGHRTFAVAAGTRDYEYGFPSPYSGASMPGQPLPVFAAMADRSPAQWGVLVSGNYRGALRHSNGTSVAAPQAARWIANEMAKGTTRVAIQTGSKGARKGKVRLHPQTGMPAPNDGVFFVPYVK